MTSFSPIPPPEHGHSSSTPTATIFDRIFGAILDVILVAFPIAIGFLIVGSLLSFPDGLALTLAALAFWAYEVTALQKRGRTLGKKLVGIEVVTQPGTNHRPDLKQTALRTLVKEGAPVLTMLGVIGLDSLVGPIWIILLVTALVTIAVDSMNRGAHDRVGGTYVIRTAKQL